MSTLPIYGRSVSEKRQLIKWVLIFQLGVFRVGIFKGEFAGWEFSGRNFPKTLLSMYMSLSCLINQSLVYL